MSQTHEDEGQWVMQPASKPAGESARMRGESDKCGKGSATSTRDDWVRRFHQ